ncbi:signaling protein [Lacinutrix sp. Bg11-31]|nr:signaling protein [Lacinutrix sp. Bg11-31]
MKIKNSFFFLLLFIPVFCFTQGKYVVKNKKGVDKINFKLLNNVIIIPVEVNDVKLSFLLDSGVSKPIVFNFLKASDSLKILNTETIYLKGLGNNGKIAALKSSGNTFKVGDAVNNNQDFYVIFDSSINFAPKLGVPIHGIIGYDLFKDLVVDISYTKKKIKLTNPEKHKYKACKKCETFNLEFYNSKPYFNASVAINNKNIPVKLLIDTGSSDALWLFENDSLGLTSKNNYFDDFLGHGLSGSVHGKRSKIDAFKLKSFTLNRPLVAYPDSSYTSILRQIKGRRGSVGGEILKRFNITMDYRKARMVLKRNSNFNQRFSYNKSGIEVENEGIRLVTEYGQNAISDRDSPNVINTNSVNVRAVFANTRKYIIKKAYTISSVRDNSPAAKAGLKKGDVILKINNNDTLKYSLQQLIYKFYGNEGDKITLEVERLGRKIKATFILESLIK